MIGSSIYRLFLFASFLILFCVSYLFGQRDTTKYPKAPTGIEDTVSAADSSKLKSPPKPYLVDFINSNNSKVISTYFRSKSSIDFSDYRYSGNILNSLPFAFINDLGSFGSPNEPVLYGFGYGDLSLSYDKKYFIDSWNSSINLHRVQSESVDEFEIVNVNRAFLYGFQNNPTAINISTKDTVIQKPISRIRYYQAPNEEGFIDAFFSARILSRLALSFRVSNNSIDENYTNSDYGAWKFNLRGIYKLGDSLFTSVDYNHHILKTPLNGGIDVSAITPTSDGVYDIYQTTNPVVYSAMSNKTSSNSIAANIYGNIFPFGFTKISTEYTETTERFKYGLDTNRVRSDNILESFRSYLNYDMILDEFSGEINAGYELLDYNLEEIDHKENTYNYYIATLFSYNLLRGIIRPSVFSKYSYYNEQSASGYGIDATLAPFKPLKFFLGYSYFRKPYSLIENLDISTNRKQSFDTFEGSVEFKNSNISASVSYFLIKMENRLIPYLLDYDPNTFINEISYYSADKIEREGINLNFSIKFWKLLLSNNTTYYMEEETNISKYDGAFNTHAGLYYIDTLFNSNLNLKTGIIFYHHDNPNFIVYDYLRMRSASFTLRNSNPEQLTFISDVNDRYRFDLYLAGRIQDAATFYFIYENLLGNTYYIVPYYPMPEGGIRIGISWDFLD